VAKQRQSSNIGRLMGSVAAVNGKLNIEQTFARSPLVLEIGLLAWQILVRESQKRNQRRPDHIIARH